MPHFGDSNLRATGPKVNWDRYWSAGHMHSCPTSFSGFYGPATRRFWDVCTRGLRANDVVLDLACGNGALLRYLADTLPPQRVPRLLGVDAARIPAQWLHRGRSEGRYNSIEILDRTPICRLPFSDQSVSMVVSQFGIEYAWSPGVCQELMRVLAPVSSIACIIHSTASQVTSVSRDELRIVDLLLSTNGVMGQAEEMIPYAMRARTESGRRSLAQNVKANQARRSFNDAIESVVQLSSTLENGQFGEWAIRMILSCLRPNDGQAEDETKSALLRLRDEFQWHQERLREQLDATIDADELSALVEAVGEQGFVECHTSKIIESGYEMGWGFFAKRR